MSQFVDTLIGENVEVATEYFRALMAKKNSGNENSGGSIGFIPFNIFFTMDGLSGIKIYNELTLDTSFLPPGYARTLDFIVTGVDHKLKDGDWETDIKATLIPKTDDIDGIITGSAPITQQIENYEIPLLNESDRGKKETNNLKVGDLYSWSKGPFNTEPDFPESYVAQILKQKTVPNKSILMPASPLEKTFEGWQTRPKTTIKVFVTKYKVTPLSTSETEIFYKEIFTKLGAPTTTGNTLFMRAWRQFEGGEATYNPFNTTQTKGAKSNYNTFYVQNYFSLNDGILSTVETLNNGKYNNIVKAFKKGIPDQVNAQKLANLLQRKFTFNQTAVDDLINSW
jgi:hypothetical protein